MLKRVTVLAGLLVSGSLGAQIQANESPLENARWGVSMGYNRTPVLGIALTGFAANEFRPAGLPLRGNVAVDFLVSDNEDSPYYRTSAYGGEEACRDSRDGRPVEDENCIPELDLAGRAELMAVLTRNLGLGAGARIDATSNPNPYGLVRVEVPSRAARSTWFGQLSVGDQFTQVDAGIAIRF